MLGLRTGTEVSPFSPVVTPGQPLQDLPELLPPPWLALLAGQDQVGVEVVGDEGGGQVSEIQLQHGTDSRLDNLILGFLFKKKQAIGSIGKDYQ